MTKIIILFLKRWYLELDRISYLLFKLKGGWTFCKITPFASQDDRIILSETFLKVINTQAAIETITKELISQHKFWKE